VPYYAPIIEAYNAHSVVGSAAHVRTLKKKKLKKKSVNDLLKSAYPKKIGFNSLLKGAIADGKKFVVKG